MKKENRWFFLWKQPLKTTQNTKEANSLDADCRVKRVENSMEDFFTQSRYNVCPGIFYKCGIFLWCIIDFTNKGLIYCKTLINIRNIPVSNNFWQFRLYLYISIYYYYTINSYLYTYFYIYKYRLIYRCIRPFGGVIITCSWQVL